MRTTLLLTALMFAIWAYALINGDVTKWRESEPPRIQDETVSY
jgi:hypothetical protein